MASQLLRNILLTTALAVWVSQVIAVEIPAHTYTYDAQGNLLTTTTRLGHTTTTTPDVLGRLSKLQLPVPAPGVARPTTTFGYNAQHDVTSVIDSRNLITAYTVNGLHQVQQVTSPDTGTATATFDAAGNRKSVKDSRAITAIFTYDALDRITAIAYPNWKSTTYTYGTTGTSAGRLAGFADESGSTVFTYNGFGRLASKTQLVASGAIQRSLAVKYTYGTSGPSTGKLVSMTYPSGVRLNVTYDAAGRIAGYSINPTQTTGTGTNLNVTMRIFADAKYSATGAPASWNWGGVSGSSLTLYARTYDLDGRVSSYTLGGIRRDLTYDDDGRLTAISSLTNSPPKQAFGYDGTGRLTRYDSGTTTYTYSYDANGNRLGGTIGTAAQTIKVDAKSNKLTSFSAQATKSYQFDAAGNQTSDESTSITYSPRGRPSTVRYGTATYSQLFNALGERVFKSSTNSAYLYDEAGQLIGEYDIATGKPRSETIYFGNMPVAVVRQATGATAQEVATQLFYVHTDHLATPRMITAAADNSVRWRWDSAEPFGLTPPTDTSPAGTFVFNQRMPGQYYDRETNLFYNYQRDYDPRTGRYIQSDPLGLAGGLNTYLYAGANPALLIDPTGEIAFLAPAIPYIASAAVAGWRAYRVYKAVSAISSAANIIANASDCEHADEDANNGNKGGAKPPKDVQDITNPPQAPVIPPDWESRPGRNGGEVYYPPGTNPADGEHIRVMPPGSSPVPGLEDGYWRWVNGNKQPINPSTGKPGSHGQTHIPLPPDSIPPPRR